MAFCTSCQFFEFCLQSSDSELKVWKGLHLSYRCTAYSLRSSYFWKRRPTEQVDTNIVRIYTANLRRVGKLFEVPSFEQKFSGLQSQNISFTAAFFRNLISSGVSSKKIFNWANVCFSENKYFS